MVQKHKKKKVYKEGSLSEEEKIIFKYPSMRSI